MIEIIWIILIGAVVGAVAKFIVPGLNPGGFFVTALLGMGGALVATFLGRLLGLYGPGQGAGFIYRDVAHAVPPDQYAEEAWRPSNVLGA